MDNHCAICGAYLADTGRMVCPECEKPKKAELKPCPFCGAEVNDKDEPINLGYVYDLDAYEVCCDRCGASGGCHDGRVEAIEAWNRRAEDGK